MAQHSTSKMMQQLGQSILGTSLSVMAGLQAVDNQVTYLSLWHGVNPTLATGLPLFTLLDGVMRIVRGLEDLYVTYRLPNTEESYDCATPSKKTGKYIGAVVTLLSAIPECLFDYQDVLTLLTTGVNTSLSITPLAMGIALTAILDLLQSITKMMLKEEPESNTASGQPFLSQPVQEVILNTVKMLGWLVVASGSPYGWAFLALGFAAQLYMTASECRSSQTLLKK